MSTSQLTDEQAVQLAARRRSLRMYRIRLVSSVIGAMALTMTVLWGWRMWDRSAGEREQQFVRDQLARFGATARIHNGHVTQLSFMGHQFKPSVFDGLDKKLPHLRRLVFIDAPLDDAALTKLASFNALGELVIIQAPITDAGLENLAAIESLTYVQLSHTQITGSGLKHLAHLRNLRRLDLKHSEVDDEDLQQLESMTQLRELYLSGTQVTDAGIARLQISLPNAIIKR